MQAVKTKIAMLQACLRKRVITVVSPFKGERVSATARYCGHVNSAVRTAV